jgi:hypothetical protein
MAQAAAAASILYFAIVFLLSFLLEKLHIIAKPPLKKGFLMSALFYIGIVLAVLGVYLYGSSKVMGILCGLVGIIMGVLKTSSDSLHSSVATDISDVKKQEPMADASDHEITDIAAEAPAAEFHEQVILNVATGKGASFVSLYLLFATFFSLCIVLLFFAVMVVFMASTFGKAQPDDIAAFFKLIASFDFGNSALRNTAGPQTDALLSAYAMAAGIALMIMAVIFGLSLRLLKRQRVSQRAVAALMPGRKRGFVPCPEGIYKLCYRNILTKNRFYCLYPWESLSLYAINGKKKQIVLKAGKMQMPLIPWEKESGMFDGLKAIVFGHLPKERQALPTKKVRYRWARAAVAVLIIFAMQVVFAGWLENATGNGKGTEYCDVGGKIHYSFRPAFATEFPYYETRDANGKALHRYCELHGVIFVTLHPTFYVPALSSLMQENKISGSSVRSVMIFEILTFPAVA